LLADSPQVALVSCAMAHDFGSAKKFERNVAICKVPVSATV
jgi:hypothetical protein